MRYVFYTFVLTVIISCVENDTVRNYNNKEWLDRTIKTNNIYVEKKGKTYLPVYSHIYHRQQNTTFDLTVTVSVRNTSSIDTLYVNKVDYYNTVGQKIRKYLKRPTYIMPMETVEIIIPEDDMEGGSGGNFMFEWETSKSNVPLIEAVMISTSGQQGLSFSVRGVIVN